MGRQRSGKSGQSQVYAGTQGAQGAGADTEVRPENVQWGGVTGVTGDGQTLKVKTGTESSRLPWYRYFFCHDLRYDGPNSSSLGSGSPWFGYTDLPGHARAPSDCCPGSAAAPLKYATRIRVDLSMSMFV